MKRTIQIQKYSDPGHGWFSVPLTVLKECDVSIDSYEYVIVNKKGTRVYFEEDCAWENLFNQLKEKGIEIKCKCFHGNKVSKIRNYPVVDIPYLKRMRPTFFNEVK